MVSRMVSYGVTMSKDDWIRITLRLPPQLHERMTELARKNKSSLNQQIVTTLYNTAGGDVWAQNLASLSADEFMAELDSMKADLQHRVKIVEEVGMKIVATLPDENDQAVQPKRRRIEAAVANDDPPPGTNLAARLKRSDPRKKKGVA